MNGQRPRTTIHRTERLWRLSQAFLETAVGSTASLQGLLRRLYAHDEEGLAHVQRVAELAGRIGDEMDLPADLLDDLERAALLHDVGRLVVPDLPGGPQLPAGVDARSRRADQVAVVDEVTSSVPFLTPAAAIVRAALGCGTAADDLDADDDPVRVAGRVLHLADTLDVLGGICVRLSEAEVRRAATAPRGASAASSVEPWLSVTVRAN